MIEGDLHRLSIVSREGDAGGVWKPRSVGSDDNSRWDGPLNFRFQVFTEFFHLLFSSPQFRLSKRHRFGETGCQHRHFGAWPQSQLLRTSEMVRWQNHAMPKDQNADSEWAVQFVRCDRHCIRKDVPKR